MHHKLTETDCVMAWQAASFAACERACRGAAAAGRPADPPQGEDRASCLCFRSAPGQSCGPHAGQSPLFWSLAQLCHCFCLIPSCCASADLGCTVYFHSSIIHAVCLLVLCCNLTKQCDRVLTPGFWSSCLPAQFCGLYNNVMPVSCTSKIVHDQLCKHYFEMMLYCAYAVINKAHYEMRKS